MKAAIVGLNFDTGQIMYQAFDGKSAIDDCHSFKRSIESDWPGTTWGIVADDEACEARTESLIGIINPKAQG